MKLNKSQQYVLDIFKKHIENSRETSIYISKDNSHDDSLIKNHKKWNFESQFIFRKKNPFSTLGFGKVYARLSFHEHDTNFSVDYEDEILQTITVPEIEGRLKKAYIRLKEEENLLEK